MDTKNCKEIVIRRDEILLKDGSSCCAELIKQDWDFFERYEIVIGCYNWGHFVDRQSAELFYSTILNQFQIGTGYEDSILLDSDKICLGAGQPVIDVNLTYIPAQVDHEEETIMDPAFVIEMGNGHSGVFELEEEARFIFDNLVHDYPCYE